MSGTIEPVIVIHRQKARKSKLKPLMIIDSFHGQLPRMSCSIKKHGTSSAHARRLQTHEIFIAHEFDAWDIGNLICGGIQGLIDEWLQALSIIFRLPNFCHHGQSAQNENGEEVLYAVLVTRCRQ
jgi:hypothetical protein